MKTDGRRIAMDSAALYAAAQPTTHTYVLTQSGAPPAAAVVPVAVNGSVVFTGSVTIRN